MADENPSVPPKVNPLGERPSTLKLKPIIRPSVGGARPGVKLPAKPGVAPTAPAPVASAPAAPAPAPAPAAASAPASSGTASASLEQLMSITQNLKSATAQIPQQAILHKTGIIADPGLTEAQMAAAKARTSRISLSEAIGIAPVNKESAPMKTIRIKRPVDLPTAAPTEPAEPAAAPAPESAASAPASAPAPTVTQRKTLKIARPGGAVRPAGKFGIKKPAAKAAEAAPADNGEVADIPELPAESSFVPANGKLAAAAGIAQSGEFVNDVSKGVAVMSLVVQIAACLAMGLLVFKFWVDIYRTSPF